MKVRQAAPPRAARRCAGLTLVEMLVALTVLGILMAIGAPGMRTLLESQRLRAASFELVADLMFARSEALKRGAQVAVSPRAGSDWSSGWRVLGGAEDAVLRERGAPGGSLLISGAPPAVRFAGNGRLSGADRVIRIELDSSALAGVSGARCVSVDLVGRARTDVGTCG